MDREKITTIIAGIRRFFWKALIVIGFSGSVTFFFAKDLLYFLLRTVDIRVYYMSLPEALFASIELALYAGIFFGLPFLISLIWHEFRPLFNMKAHQGYLYVLFSILLFYAGGLFCCYIVLPSGIKFLLSFGTGNIKPMISIERFVRFSTAMIFAFGITFEVPVILLALGRLGLVKSQMLTRTRRFAVLFIVIASALITPTPDIYNMMLLAVPAYVLYEIGIVLMKIEERKRLGNKGAP
jgi:sec-independent protein translocase protein TatC